MLLSFLCLRAGPYGGSFMPSVRSRSSRAPRMMTRRQHRARRAPRAARAAAATKASVAFRMCAFESKARAAGKLGTLAVNPRAVRRPRTARARSATCFPVLARTARTVFNCATPRCNSFDRASAAMQPWSIRSTRSVPVAAHSTRARAGPSAVVAVGAAVAAAGAPVGSESARRAARPPSATPASKRTAVTPGSDVWIRLAREMGPYATRVSSDA